MTDFRTVPGFEDVWRPPVRPRPRCPETVLRPAGGEATRARLARLVAKAPEVMVKVTGRTRDRAHLAAHLTYITRNGDLLARDQDDCELTGRSEVRELADDWAVEANLDRRRRRGSPLSVAMILSMPAGVDALRLRDAASAFAQEAFTERFEYVLVLHTDTAHPHVHLTVRAAGLDGARLNPKKGDLEAWRQAFAQALRDRGVAAEATPRRARGVTRKAERGPVRRIRERHAAGEGALGRVAAEKLRDAARTAFAGDAAPRAWEAASVRRQARVRGLYLAQARVLQGADEPVDRDLGARVAAFVAGFPAPDTERLKLVRELRAANARLAGKDFGEGPRRGR